jgi:hypothetical protein
MSAQDILFEILKAKRESGKVRRRLERNIKMCLKQSRNGENVLLRRATFFPQILLPSVKWQQTSLVLQ